MPSIREIFADPDLSEPGGEDVQIDLDKVLNSVTDILNDRPSVPDDTPAPEAEPEPEEDLPSGGEQAEVEEESEELPPAPVDPPPPDPWLEIPPERRAAMLALDQTVMADPDKRAKVFGILSGDSDAPPVPTTPSLPEHVDPDSFEAQIWRENQEIKAQLREIGTATKAQAEITMADRARVAASTAANRFQAKYSQLSEQDVIDVARYAGQTGIASAFMTTAEAKADPIVGYEQALEHVLWTNESFRGRVLGTSALPPEPPGNQPEAVERKRKLTALSGAASPVSGPAPQRSPLEHGVDGKLTEKSRSQLVKDAANMLRQSNEG